MRNLICTMAIAMLTSGGFAQTNSGSIPKQSVTGNSFLHTSIEKDTFPPNKNWEKRLPYHGMPNVITVKPIPPVYKGNNLQGFAIYESPIDNMPILIPDSGFRSAMPNALITQQKGDSILTTPRKIPDFLYRKQRQPSRY